MIVKNKKYFHLYTASEIWNKSETIEQVIEWRYWNSDFKNSELYECILNGIVHKSDAFYLINGKNNKISDIDYLLNSANNYWSGKISKSPKIEFLFEGEVSLINKY